MPDYKEARELVIEEVTYHKYHNGKTGKFYSQFIQALASDPCIIGYHHCGFIQSWQTPRRKTYATRSSFNNPFGEAYKVFTERVTQTNLQINAWHKSRMRNEEKRIHNVRQR